MLILPLLALFLFLLVLGLKLLGGAIAWWIVITLGVILLLPIVIICIAEMISRLRQN